MKNLFIAFCILFSTTIFAQEEWGNIVNNEVTMKEIGPVWPGCEEGNAKERDDCFNQKTSVSGGTKALQDEAKRNIMTIPKMSKPGMLAGKPRAIKMTVPFTFKTGK